MKKVTKAAVGMFLITVVPIISVIVFTKIVPFEGGALALFLKMILYIIVGIISGEIGSHVVSKITKMSPLTMYIEINNALDLEL